MTEEPALAAGDFSAWLAQLDAALAGRGDAEVPCDGCTACCRASQFVHVGPDEVDARAHIPTELLFPAPGLAAGHHLMGYDERGHCPMLVDDRCSIYEHRPQACRTYDCRIFPATGLDLRADEDPTKGEIATRARRWVFGYPGPDDLAARAAVAAAASYLVEHPEVVPAAVPGARAPSNTTEVAVLAVEVHEPFLGGGPEPEPEAVQVAIRVATSGRRVAR